jgi:hypothetical protein
MRFQLNEKNLLEVITIHLVRSLKRLIIYFKAMIRQQKLKEFFASDHSSSSDSE